MPARTLIAVAALVVSTQAWAQGAAPSCALSSSPGQTNNVVESALACVAELDGNGKQNLIVGRVTGGSGYVIILNYTGTVRKKICWGSSGACPAIVP